MNNEKRTQKALIDLLVKRVDRFIANNPDYVIDADVFNSPTRKRRCLLGAAFPKAEERHYLDSVAALIKLTPLEVGNIEAGFIGNSYIYTYCSDNIDFSHRHSIDDYYYGVGQKVFKRLQKKYGSKITRSR